MLHTKRSEKRRNKALTLVEVLISIGIFMTTSAVLLASLQQYHKTMQEVQNARVMNALLHQTVWNVMKLRELPPLPLVGIIAQRDVDQVIARLEEEDRRNFPSFSSLPGYPVQAESFPPSGKPPSAFGQLGFGVTIACEGDCGKINLKGDLTLKKSGASAFNASGTFQCIKTTVWFDKGLYSRLMGIGDIIVGAAMGLTRYVTGAGAEEIANAVQGKVRLKGEMSFGNPLGDGGANSACSGGDYMCVVAYSVNLDAEPLDFIWVENLVKVYKNGQYVGMSSAFGAPCLWMCGPKIGPFPAAKGDKIKAELWQLSGCCWTLLAQVLLYKPGGALNMSTYKGSPGGFTARETYNTACSPNGPRKVWEGVVTLP